jgi:hypothetical protein
MSEGDEFKPRCRAAANAERKREGECGLKVRSCRRTVWCRAGKHAWDIILPAARSLRVVFKSLNRVIFQQSYVWCVALKFVC